MDGARPASRGPVRDRIPLTDAPAGWRAGRLPSGPAGPGEGRAAAGAGIPWRHPQRRPAPGRGRPPGRRSGAGAAVPPGRDRPPAAAGGAERRVGSPPVPSALASGWPGAGPPARCRASRAFMGVPPGGRWPRPCRRGRAGRPSGIIRCRLTAAGRLR